MLTTLISFLVVIGVLVFVHELGHLVAAKSVGILCPRFSIGFGPRIAGFQWGETEYIVSLLPLGGYVRMVGMEDTSALEGGEEEEPFPAERAFDTKPLWARIWVVTAGVIMNFLFAILVIAGVSFYYGEPVNPSTRVAVSTAQPLTGALAPLATVPLGAELQAVGDREVESWNDVDDALRAVPAGPLTLRFSDTAPVTLSVPASDSGRTATLQAIQPFLPPVIGEVSPSTPASRAGLLAGDRVRAVGGVEVGSWTQLVEIIRANPERALRLQIERAGQLREVAVTPEGRRDEIEQVEIGWLGVAADFEEHRRPIGFGESVARGVDVTWSTSAAIVGLLGDLFTGDASPRSLGGPLTIGQLSGETARAGMEQLFSFMALLSVNLAVLNLMPIPVLDGGQLLFLLVEGVRGRPLSVEQRLRLSNVGLVLVVGIMVWALTNDFLRLFGL